MPHLPCVRDAVLLAALLTLILAPAGPATAQSTRVAGAGALSDSARAEQPGGYRRRRTTAMAIGAVLPGAGHLYAGEWLKSYPTFATTTSTIALGVVLFHLDRCSFTLGAECRSGVPVEGRVVGALMVGSGALLWAVSARDAGRAVGRQRARRAARARHALAPTVVPGGPGGHPWRLGFAIAP